MKQALIVLVALVALALPRVAAAQGSAPNSRKAQVHFVAAMVVGDKTLKEGDYQLQCITIDGKDFLVVTSPHDGLEVARVPCRPTTLTAASKADEYRSRQAADGTRTLTSVRFRGETVEHTVVTN